MLMLLGLLPLALVGFAFDNDDDDNSVEVVGTADDDNIEGTQGDDFLDGGAGDDVLIGRAGDDTIFGREGDDVLQGEDGNDMLCSGDGNDVITGNRGHDTLEGQGDDDWVSGDYGHDLVRGDDGNDTVIGGRGIDTVEGGDGDDLVFGGIINNLPLNEEELVALRDGDSLEELNGGIEIRDDRFANILRGGVGDDDIVMGSGDRAGGGVGEDTFHLMSEQNEEGGEASIMDYNGDDDAITVIVDDTENPESDVDVQDDGADALVLFGDQVLVRIEGAAGSLTAADISLISESTVEGLFDPNPVT